MIGEIDHVYYWVRDMDAAVAFYRDVLELPLVRRDGDEWAEFEAGPVRLALHGSSDDRRPGSGTVVFRVDDLDEARIVLARRGAPTSTSTSARSRGSRASRRCATPTATRCS